MSDGHEDGAKPPGYRLMLREMAADERPREKLKLRGSAALSDGELLAIILNTGIDRTTRRVYVHSYTRRGRRQLRTRGAANADGGQRASAQLVGVRLCGTPPVRATPASSPRQSCAGSRWIDGLCRHHLGRNAHVRLGVIA